MAIDSLHSTHLYGRRLVLQYAAEERTVEAMRDKLRGEQLAAQAAASSPSAHKKRKGGAADDVGDVVNQVRL